MKGSYQKNLGPIQRDVLDALIRHGRWSEACGWHWNGWSRTKRIMDSLVRRGLAEVENKLYTPTDAGREEMKR